MSYLYYVLPATVTFLIALSAFFRDTAASKTSVLNWAFVIVAGLLWPITLPFIIWKKLSSLFIQDEVKFVFRRSHTVERQSHII
ncbi:hypothetical protein [Leptothoe spongobia]|uniref:Uncharacterized protein n=1 Tax=Leptothoe spongobia TAU-MAC 1115 TaxID=1967444 RepID=A0A947DEK1_9CYAN|nr:hypothetical protein [Leptothoe spongobia]MBT9315593.1 hypothetical protein [Leptothoe spongobia TAU-MAC 1115]